MAHTELVMRKIWIALVVPALLVACDSATGPQEGPGLRASALVNTIDEQGRPFRPDTVVWYYPPEGDRYDGRHPAQCIIAGCYWWAVPEEVSGPAYVSATWKQSIPGNANCWYLAFAAAPIIASADSPPAVTLRMSKQEACT